MNAGGVGTSLGRITATGAEAEVWYAWCGAHLDRVDALSHAVLSPEERSRLDRYRSRAAAERYVVTRSLVRSVLASHLGVAPVDVRVTRTQTGKPVLSDELHFNVTHSGDLILLAVSSQRPVGVDVERRRPVPRVVDLETRWLTHEERRDFATLRRLGISASDAFLRVWSLKEARLKALGVGISGAGGASFTKVQALPLDELLSTLSPDGDDVQYVGAIAFA
ncbi:MAG TPA: 4'-phosphopantetheinyl transferase superfamily protein [Gemmatimonadaceae bacterium]|nr:4'-phosphopantetheinyl transferase superfamily protein [Gemmatimonadaceae bacterium]